MSRTRRTQPAVRKPRRPSDSRTRPLWDETEQDNGIYYKCWHCGFTCNDKRDELGGSNSRDGVTHDSFAQTSVPQSGPVGIEGFSDLILGGSRSVNITYTGIGHVMTLVRADSNGNAVEPKHYLDISGSGCPLCHSKNWRGDY